MTFYQLLFIDLPGAIRFICVGCMYLCIYIVVFNAMVSLLSGGGEVVSESNTGKLIISLYSLYLTSYFASLFLLVQC